LNVNSPNPLQAFHFQPGDLAIERREFWVRMGNKPEKAAVIDPEFTMSAKELMEKWLG